MHICYISHGDLIHVRPYIEYFKSEGHDVSLISLTSKPDYGVPVYTVGFGKYTSKSGKWKYPLSMLRARKIVNFLKPDVVHAHYATSGGLAAWVCGFHPVIVTVHGSDLSTNRKSIIWKMLLKRIFNFADRVNVVSDDLKKMVLEMGISTEKIDVLTLGIDTGKFLSKRDFTYSKGQTLRIINTRRLEAVYDHQTILKALYILNKQKVDFRMTFVGNGELESELRQMACRLGLSDKVTFVGGCDNSQMPQYLCENDVYLSASLRDGTSLCLLEAMASGLFPIVTDIPANSAWIDNKLTGFLHNVRDAEGLAKQIIRFINDPSIYGPAVEKNQARVIANGDRFRNMKKLQSVYEELMSVKRLHK